MKLINCSLSYRAKFTLLKERDRLKVRNFKIFDCCLHITPADNYKKNSDLPEHDYSSLLSCDGNQESGFRTHKNMPIIRSNIKAKMHKANVRDIEVIPNLIHDGIVDSEYIFKSTLDPIINNHIQPENTEPTIDDFVDNSWSKFRRKMRSEGHDF